MSDSEMEPAKKPWWKRWFVRAPLCLVILYGLLCVPADEPPLASPASSEPFLWSQDELWEHLTELSRGSTCASAETSLVRLEEYVRNEIPANASPVDDSLTTAEELFFQAAAAAASCPSAHAERLSAVQSSLREQTKRLSQTWDLADRISRERLYRLLYGTRMALEEVLLQLPIEEAGELSLQHGADIPSSADFVEREGIRIHSGDIALSRGNAPISALIARGNDFPGNFSHVALVHVEGRTLSTVEAHIEQGLVFAGEETYFRDEKLRMLLLRVRPEVASGRAAGAAADWARTHAMRGHVPYDFEMAFDDPAELFCSEVAAAAYLQESVPLWQLRTTTSAPHVARWLGALGVRHFETYGPSDLEYDPQVAVVAEWRNLGALFDDHVDDAVIDAMLTSAEHGAEVQYARARLGFARLLKGYSSLMLALGREATIPEGMNATVALRVAWFRDEFARIKRAVLSASDAYVEEQGHRPPYWELVRMANDAAGEGA